MRLQPVMGTAHCQCYRMVANIYFVADDYNHNDYNVNDDDDDDDDDNDGRSAVWSGTNVHVLSLALRV